MQKFSVRDIVFLAMMAALFLLGCAPFVPFIMNVTKLGVQAAVTAIIYGVICTIGLRKVPKPGALTIIGLFSGMVLLFMQPVMFVNQVVGGIVAEIIALALFRTYTDRRAVATAAGIYALCTLPTTAVVNWFAKGRTLMTQVGEPLSFVLVVVLSVVLGFVGVWIGQKIADDLQKAGKLA